MLNPYKKEKLRRIRRLISEEEIDKLQKYPCKYISNFSKVYCGNAYFHNLALIVRLEDDIYDEYFFTYFWI